MVYSDKDLIDIIKKYDKRDAIQKISHLIRKVEDLDPNSWRGYRPWDLLSILNLIILNADFKPNKRINENNIHELLDIILKITNIPHEDQNPEKTLRKTMRVLAYQQFFWYERAFIDNISRQIIMIKSISNTRIDELFQKETGLKIEIFAQVLFVIWTWVLTYDELFLDLNDITHAEIKKNDLDKVIRYISRDEVELREIILGGVKKENYKLPIFDRSSIIKFPIIRLEQNYLLYSKTVLENYFNLFILLR